MKSILAKRKGEWYMKTFLAGMMILVLVAASLANAQAAGMWDRNETGYEESQDYRTDSTPPVYSYGVYKTQEQVAWDLLMYGLKNIPEFASKIKSYDDFLEAYREALILVKDPRKPGTVR
jgi:hypothetical protein